MKRYTTLFLILLLAIFSAFGLIAQEEDPEATPEAMPEATEEAQMQDTSTFVRFAHFAPNVEGVDIFVNDEVIEETNLSFSATTSWMPVEAGSYGVDVAQTGSSIEDAVISVDGVQVGPGFVTVAVIEDAEGNLTPFVIQDGLSDLLPMTSGLTFLNALSGEPIQLNFNRDDVPFVTELSAETNRSLYIPIDSGTYSITATTTDPEQGGDLASTSEFEAIDGNYYLVALVGTVDNPQLFIQETRGAQYALLNDTLQAPGTLVDAVVSQPALEGYTEILEQAGLVETLSGDDMLTVFLPADYLTDEINAMVGDDTEMLTNVLQNHVIEGSVPLGQLTDMGTITTLAGNEYEITIEGNTVYVNGNAILTTNIYAINGVIHIIDGILTLPEEG